MSCESPDSANLLDDLCLLPIADIGVISRMHPSEYGGLEYSTTFGDRTFFCITFGIPAVATAVFFLGDRGDEIELRLLKGEVTDFSELSELLQADNSCKEGFCHTGIGQLLSPLLGVGGDRLTGLTMILADRIQGGDRIIGVVFQFPFSIQLGLHIFDDDRLSFSFNSACDVVVGQAMRTAGIRVVGRKFQQDEKPHYAEIDWFDWLKFPGRQ